MKITLLGRSFEVSHNFSRPPSVKNPGGGVVTKMRYIKKAIPRIEIISDIEKAGAISFTECLWFLDKYGIGLYESVKAYKALQSFKILLISDPSFCRMEGSYRDDIFNSTDIILVSSEYTRDWISACAPRKKIRFIGDPIDMNDFNPQRGKSNSIVGCSKISHSKNIPAIIDIYSALPKRIEKGYIGGWDLWGDNADVDKGLAKKLCSVSDWVVSNAVASEVSDIYSGAKAYISDSKYDTYCYAMVEAMASGMWCFLGNHPLFDSVPHAFRFSTVDEAAEIITSKMREISGSCEESVQFVSDNYSLDVYRKKISDMIGRGFVYG